MKLPLSAYNASAGRIYQSWRIQDADKFAVATMSDLPNESQAAGFIVRACNSHEELLDALRISLATIERIQPPKPYDATQGTRDVIEAAIARATGETTP